MKNISEILSQRRNHSRVEPTRTPQLDLLEKDETKVKRPSMWNVIFYNDEFTTMDFVQFVVMNVFHKSVEDALAFMLLVHTEGKGIAGTYTHEVAEQKQADVLLAAKIEQHPLRVELERV